MVNKKIVIIVTIITIVIVAIIVGIKIKELKNTDYASSEISNKINENILTGENDVSNINNTEKEENNVVSEPPLSENTTTNTVEDSNTEKSDEDRAIDFAKKEWGENDQNVYYYVEEKLSEDIYIISVRSKETTAGLMDYEVNIKTGEISEY